MVYGTLIVGLPLWFASYPANPLRAENVIDDFVSRVGMGLKPHFRRLRNRRCPFWRIVVVWKTSAQSMREWTSRARFDVYDDPALRDLGAVPAKIGSLASLLVDTLPGGLKLFVYGARPEKLEKHVRLPQRMGPILQKLEDVETCHRPRIHQRIRWRILQRCVELTCFVRRTRAPIFKSFKRMVLQVASANRVWRSAIRRNSLSSVHGLAGLERWIVARLSSPQSPAIGSRVWL